MKTIRPMKDSLRQKWYIIDAEGKVLGRIAVAVASILRGKNKPTFTPNMHTGDSVVIINAAKAKVTGGKETKKVYYRHSLYPGGIYSDTYAKLVARKPTRPMELAIKGMLPKGPLGYKLFRCVKIYAGSEHPHASQKPEQLTV